MSQRLADRVETLDFAPGNRFEYEPSFRLRGPESAEAENRRRP